MKRVSLIMLGVVASCAMFLCAYSTSMADEPILSQQRLPQQVYGFLTIRNTEELKTKFSESQLGKILNLPEFETVKEQITNVLDERTSEFEEEVGISLEDFMSIPQGEISFAVFQPLGQSIAILAIVDFGDNQETIQTLLDKASEKMQDEGAELTTETFEETEISIFTNTGEENDFGNSSESKFAYCIKDSSLLLCNEEQAIQQVLSRWDGENENNFTENEVYKYLAEKCRGGGSESAPLISWYLDPIGLFKSLLTANPDAPPQAAMALGFLPVLGIDKLKAVGGTVNMGTDQFDTVTRMLIYMEPPTTGLLNVFQFPADAQSPPAWVTSDVSSYSMINWNITEAYEAVETLVDTFQGPGALALVLDQLSDTRFNGELHVKDDILDLLTGKIRVVSVEPDPDNPNENRSLVALEVHNTDDAQGTIAKITAIEGFPGESREFQGTTIYEIPAAGLMPALDPQAQNADQKIGIAVAKDHLMFAADVTLLEKILRADPDAEKLTESEVFKQLVEFLPSKVSSFSFRKDDAELRPIYETLQSGNAEFLLGPALSGIDLSELPDFELLRDYLSPSGSFMIPDERGLYIQSFSVKKEGK